MHWTTQAKRALAILVLLAAPAVAMADEGGMVDVELVLGQAAVTEPLNLKLAFYPIEWGTDGQLRLRNAEVGYVTYDPSTPSRVAKFNIQLKPLTQYQVTIDIVDPETGEADKSMAYVFAGDLAQITDERRVKLVPGRSTPVSLTLKKELRSGDKGNFVDVFPSSDSAGQFELAVYFGPDQVTNEVNEM